MAAFLSVHTSTIILAVIAVVYSVISVVLLAFICCLCYRKRKFRAVTPKDDYISPQPSEAELEPGSNPSSPVKKGPIDISSAAAAQKNQPLPRRYRSKGRKKAIQAAETCPEWEGVRDSPVLRQKDAWSIEKDLDNLSSHPITPDSGLALSLGESKYGDSSSKESQSTTGSNEDVFDENVASDLSKSFEEKKRELRRRAPKPVRTESTMPLMDEDDDTFSPGSDMEFNAKATLPPIREKLHSPDSLDGRVFVNRSAIDGTDSETTTYTELSTINTHQAVGGRRGVLPPIHGHGLGGLGLEERDLKLLSKVGRLPPLYPPGHSQENIHELEEQSTNL